MVAFNFTRFTKFLAPAMSCVSFFGTKSRGTFFCMPDDSSVLDEKSEYLGLNRRIYRIESAQVKFKTQAQSKMWDFFGRQTTSFLDQQNKMKEFIVCTLCGLHCAYHGNTSLRQHLASHRSHRGAQEAIVDNQKCHRTQVHEGKGGI